MITALLLAHAAGQGLGQNPRLDPKATRRPQDAVIKAPFAQAPKLVWLPVIANYTPKQPEFDPAKAGEGANEGLLSPKNKPLPYALVPKSKWQNALKANGLAIAPGPGKAWDASKVLAAGKAVGADYVGMIVLAGARYGSNPHQSWITVEGAMQLMDVKTGKYGEAVLVSGSDTSSPADSQGKKYSATVRQAAFRLGSESAPLEAKSLLAKAK